MNVENPIKQQIKAAIDALNQIQSHCSWKFFSGELENPFAEGLSTDSWPTLGEAQAKKVAPGTGWLWAKIQLPSNAQGLNLSGSPVGMYLAGILPTECYINGELLLKERYWAASGPALLPVESIGENGAAYTVAVRTVVSETGVPGWLTVFPVIQTVDRTVEELDTFLAEITIAECLAQTDEDRRLINSALELFDLAALEERSWNQVFSSIKECEKALMHFSEAAKKHTVHLIGHAHIDMNWLWDWQDTIDTVIRDFKSVLSIMRDYPEFTFSHSQVATYELIREKEPELFQEVLQRIKEGRWEVTASTWVEGDLNMAAGESLARHFLYADAYCRQVLGTEPTVVWEPDTFGHPDIMPQLARQAGIPYYFHMRCNPGGKDRYPVYWWEGRDGSKLLTASEVYNGSITAGAVADALITHRRFNGSAVSFHMHGVGDHGGGPARSDLDRLRRLQARPLMPIMICSTMKAFADAAVKEETQGSVEIPVVKGELNFIFEGCYTTHADIKEQNRSGENLLLTAETLGALAGTVDKAKVASAWQSVLFSQFHDILDGSGIVPTYEKSAQDYEYVKAIAQDQTSTALLAMLEEVSSTAPGQLVAVVNQLPWDRKDIVRFTPAGVKIPDPVLVGADGRQIPGQWVEDDLAFVCEVPALGRSVYSLVSANGDSVGIECQEPQRNGEGWLVENDRYKAILLQDSGIIGSLFDKSAGCELVAYGVNNPMTHVPNSRPDLALNVLQVQDERHHAMSGWLIDGIVREESLINGSEVTLISHGPVCTVFRVIHKVRNSSVQQDIVFYRSLDRIDFLTTVDWREIGSPEVGVPNLKAAFTADLSKVEALYEVPYGVAARTPNGQERPALRWAGVAGECSGKAYGFAIINDCKYGYDALGSRIRLSLMRSPYDPDLRPDCRIQKLAYSFQTFIGAPDNSSITRRAAEFNQPVLAGMTNKEALIKANHRVSALPLFKCGEWTSVVISAVKKAEENDNLVVRFFETAGQPVDISLEVNSEFGKIWQADILEKVQLPLDVDNGRLHLSFRPWEVKTIILEFR